MTNETLPEYRAIILSAKAEWDCGSNEDATIEAMICECFNCHEADISDDGSVWIAFSPGSSGEWLDIGSMAKLVRWMRDREFIAPAPTRAYRVLITRQVHESMIAIVNAESVADAENQAVENAMLDYYADDNWTVDDITTEVQALWQQTVETDEPPTPLFNQETPTADADAD